MKVMLEQSKIGKVFFIITNNNNSDGTKLFYLLKNHKYLIVSPKNGFKTYDMSHSV